MSDDTIKKNISKNIFGHKRYRVSHPQSRFASQLPPAGACWFLIQRG